MGGVDLECVWCHKRATRNVGVSAVECAQRVWNMEGAWLMLCPYNMIGKCPNWNYLPNYSTTQIVERFTLQSIDNE